VRKAVAWRGAMATQAFELHPSIQPSYFILALPPPLGREKKLSPAASPGGRLWARKVLDIGIVSPELHERQLKGKAWGGVYTNTLTLKT
jgi:hypothetical protein